MEETKLLIILTLSFMCVQAIPWGQNKALTKLFQGMNNKQNLTHIKIELVCYEALTLNRKYLNLQYFLNLGHTTFQTCMI